MNVLDLCSGCVGATPPSLSHSRVQFFRTSASYGVATTSRFLKIIGLFCKKILQKRRYSAKMTYNFGEPTNCSHPIPPSHLCAIPSDKPIACLLVYMKKNQGFIHICKFKGLYIYVQKQLPVFLHIYRCFCTYMCMNMYVYTYMYEYTHVYL